MPLSLNIGKCTLLGNYRENNEDSLDVKLFPELTVCIVADGMGGQAAGERNASGNAGCPSIALSGAVIFSSCAMNPG